MKRNQPIADFVEDKLRAYHAAQAASATGPSEIAAQSGAFSVTTGSRAVSSANSFVLLEGAELSEAKEALCMCVQLLRGWHSDGTAWSPHDTEVERRICALQQRLEMPAEEVPRRHTGSTNPAPAASNMEMTGAPLSAEPKRP